ncbi:hypothetical protein B0H63DRAFT_517821 [Podospora didyma]|uniref:AA1-like domain-containing protein n=1 Tax=Podospora didyma TaxID=330526 RepID=A0AAE0U8R4_9PEZI|nr:hypothetical protein B0H63DRAFT_517821 [Podospora didyma]
MLPTTLLVQSILALASMCLAMPSEYHMYPRVIVPQLHYEVLKLRAATDVNPKAALDTTCLDRNTRIVFHDQNVAELSICGGIAGSITKCEGKPASTTGRSGTALFTLRTVDQGATINISKGRWEQCVRAARAVCPTGSLSSTCVGGASTGNVAFTLTGI